MQARIENPALSVSSALEALQRLGASATTAGIPETTLYMVHLRASQINGCSVCVDIHSRELEHAGESSERILTVAAWRETPYFSDAERAALALTEAATRLADRPDPVPDEVWDEPRATTVNRSLLHSWSRSRQSTRSTPERDHKADQRRVGCPNRPDGRPGSLSIEYAPRISLRPETCRDERAARPAPLASRIARPKRLIGPCPRHERHRPEASVPWLKRSRVAVSRATFTGRHRASGVTSGRLSDLSSTLHGAGLGDTRDAHGTWRRRAPLSVPVAVRLRDAVRRPAPGGAAADEFSTRKRSILP
jgi:AhpD family alkylhydroperoxidase